MSNTTDKLMATIMPLQSANNGRRGNSIRSARVVNIPSGTLPALPSFQSEVSPASGSKSRRRRRNRRNGNGLSLYTTMSNVPNSTRSGLEPNPADPRNTFRQLGNTPNGAMWALKALHPCGEHNSCVPKIADGSASESVVMERRDEYNIAKPAGLDTPTWTVVIIQHPFLEQDLLAICGADESMNDVNIQQVYVQAFTTGRIAASSPQWTEYTTASADAMYYQFCDHAVLDYRTLPGANTDNYYQQYFKTIRRTYCGLTIDFDCNSLTDKGRVTSGQFQAIIDIRAITDATTEDAGTVPVYQLEFPAVTEADIVQEDLLCRQAEAKTGEYAPMRMWQPVINFVPATAARIPHVAQALDVDVTVNQTPTIWFEGWGIYVSRWDGIDQTSSLRIKRKEGLEMVVGRASPYGPFNTPGFPDDPRSVSIVKEFSRTEPHAYEADYNSKNLMQRGIFGGIGNILGGLGIPILSDLGPVLGNVLDSILPI